MEPLKGADESAKARLLDDGDIEAMRVKALIDAEDEANKKAESEDDE